MRAERDWLPLSGEGQLAIARGGTRVRRFADIIRAVSVATGFSQRMLLGPRRTGGLAQARQLAMLIARDCCPWMSYPEIGRFCGGRHHKTIMHGCQAARRRIEADESYRAVYKAALESARHGAARCSGTSDD